MSTYNVQVKQTIPASSTTIYKVLCDYEEGHRAILPEPYFTDMIVEKGGQGAGTIALVHMNVMGAKRSFRLETFEPEPGRILEEVDQGNGNLTRFIIEQVDDDHCLVTIASEFHIQPGFKGWLERLTNPPIIRHIYKKELQNLVSYVSS